MPRTGITGAYAGTPMKIERDPQRNEKTRRQMARQKVAKAIKRGELVRLSCEWPGCDDDRPGQAHHVDYDKPLEVTFYCQRHHAKADAQRRAQERGS